MFVMNHKMVSGILLWYGHIQCNWAVIRNGNRSSVVIRVVLWIQKSSPQNIIDPVLIYNQPYNCQFIAGSFVKTTGSQRFLK